MSYSYKLFNGICLTVSGCFVLATFWLWRGSFAQATVVEDLPQEISFAQISQTKSPRDESVVGTTQQATTTSPPVRETPDGSTEAGNETMEKTSVHDLPTELNLAVPFTSQAPEHNWDEPWQDACEEAAVLMLDAYYKEYGLSPLFARDELLEMVSWEEARGWGLSIEMEKMKLLVEQFVEVKNKRVVIKENPSVDEIKRFIANGQPVLVVADGKVLPNPHFRNGGPEYHALIIRGYTPEKFITNDPGTQFGENFTYTYNDLMNAIHDWNDGDVKNGKRVVLVIE